MIRGYIWILELALGTQQRPKKLEKNDSKITLYILLKAAATKKVKVKCLGAFCRRISLHNIEKWVKF